MAELARFRVTRRADTTPVPSTGRIPAYPTGLSPTTLISDVIEAAASVENPAGVVRSVGLAFLDSSEFVDPTVPNPRDEALSQLDRLERWVSSHPDASRAELRTWLAVALTDGEDGSDEEVVAFLTSTEWRAFRARLADSLVALLISGSTWPPDADDSRPYTWLVQAMQALTRYILLCALLESALTCGDGQWNLRCLLGRVLILPCPPFPLPYRSRLARLPAFSDMYVVKDEWARYVPGEIAYIENVLRGELKERSRRTTDELRTTESVTETVTTTTRDETETTDRTLMKEQTQTDTNLTVGVEGQVDTSGQYGPTHVETHLGASVQYSRAESAQRASEVAHETVERAISQTERLVSETRTRARLQRTVDFEKHAVDNATAPEGHVVGVYRWVDKIQRFQVFRYPHRYLLEFEIPEPATFVRWLAETKPKPQGMVSEPVPFTVDGKPTGKPLTVDAITEDNYPLFAARYQVVGLPEVPAKELSVTESWVVDGGTRADAFDNYATMPFPPTAAKEKEISIPDGYEASSAVAAVSASPQLAAWRDWTDWANTSPGDDGVTTKTGWHEIVATLEIAGRTATASTVSGDADPSNTVNTKPGVYHSFWLNKEFRWKSGAVPQREIVFDSKPTQKMSASASLGGAYKASVTVSVKCHPTAQTVSAWRSDVYARLRAAFEQQHSDWLQEQATLDAEPLIPIPAGSPTRHRASIREELKRQVIEMLVAETFNGIDALTMRKDSWSRINLDVAERAAPYIQFLEQAFEWSSLTYILYPYYWAASDRWASLQPLDGEDADYVDFLRCGSARVVLPVRPKFETAAQFFMTFGLPWGGGPAPTPGSDLYVALADEIRELTQGPGDGIPEDTWEARLPTTLIWLDPDPAMPKLNTEATLPKTLPGEGIDLADTQPQTPGTQQ